MTTPGKPPEKPRRGRPRLGAEEVQARIDAYCSRYGISPNAEGLPPFPAGRRETKQHREWMSVYRAHRRLTDGDASGGRRVSQKELSELLEVQDLRCPICGERLELDDAVIDTGGDGDTHAALHKRCRDFVILAASLGRDGLERTVTYLWPRRPAKPKDRA